MDSILKRGMVLDKRWVIGKYLCDGIFGTFYFKVKDKVNPSSSFALKGELYEKQETPNFLPMELQLLLELFKNKPKHTLSLENYGVITGEPKIQYIIVKGFYSKTIHELRMSLTEHRFSISTCLQIAKQTLLSIQEIHDVGFVHRDIKPMNIVIAKGDNLRKVHLINFEMCRKIVDDKGKVLAPRALCAFRGSPRYASISALLGNEQGRVDDLWSLLFTFIEIIVGKLPFSDDNGPIDDIAKYCFWLAEVKKHFVNDPKKLLAFCPREIRKLYDHLVTLSYETKPNYNLCLSIFNEIMDRKVLDENVLDWETFLNNKK